MIGTFNRSYFFDAGIRFTCTQCGNCCTGTPGKVRVSDRESREIREFLKVTDHDFRERFCRVVDGDTLLREKTNGDCIFYDRGCTVYSVRPAQCRTYPFWFKNLRSEVAWARTSAECPGIGHGRLYSKEEILEMLVL